MILKDIRRVKNGYVHRNNNNNNSNNNNSSETRG
jgi:hypothetical protein